MTAAKDKFFLHIKQCEEAIQIYDFLANHGYKADFGLRFIWVASISALDHYVSELIIERATEHFSQGMTLSNKLLGEGVPVSAIIKMYAASPMQAAIEFRGIISQVVRFKSFQKADDISDGLSYIWSEMHKWNAIAKSLGMDNKSAKRKLNSVAYRRDSIVHNADFDESVNTLRECRRSDAVEAKSYISRVVEVIDDLVMR